MFAAFDVPISNIIVLYIVLSNLYTLDGALAK
jgi:hypothetical protein